MRRAAKALGRVLALGSRSDPPPSPSHRHGCIPYLTRVRGAPLLVLSVCAARVSAGMSVSRGTACPAHARDRVTPRLHTRGCGAPGLNSTSLNRDLINREGSFYVLALDSFSRLRSPPWEVGRGAYRT